MSSRVKPGGVSDPLDPDWLSLQAHRLVVGGLGAALPVLVWLFAGLRPTRGIDDNWALLDAVSAYYYTGGVSVFVGVLFALSLFLLTYQGYRDALADRVVAGLGGVAGLVVAIVPTEPPLKGMEAPWWQPWQGQLHYVAATVLFASLALFCLWLFRKSNIQPPSARPFEKRVRNAIFLVCGITILVCMLLAWLNRNASIFWPETGAIEAFAFSWLLKSGAHENVVQAAKQRLRLAPRAAAEPGE